MFQYIITDLLLFLDIERQITQGFHSFVMIIMQRPCCKMLT